MLILINRIEMSTCIDWVHILNKVFTFAPITVSCLYIGNTIKQHFTRCTYLCVGSVSIQKSETLVQDT